MRACRIYKSTNNHYTNLAQSTKSRTQHSTGQWRSAWKPPRQGNILGATGVVVVTREAEENCNRRWVATAEGALKREGKAM